MFSHIRFRPKVAVKLGARLMKLSDLDSAGQGVSRIRYNKFRKLKSRKKETWFAELW